MSTEYGEEDPNDSEKVEGERDDPEYRIGYGCPPRHTRFPNQRNSRKRKRSKPDNQIIRKFANKKVWVTRDGARQYLKIAEILLLVVRDERARGNGTAREIASWLEQWVDPVEEEPVTPGIFFTYGKLPQEEWDRRYGPDSEFFKTYYHLNSAAP